MCWSEQFLYHAIFEDFRPLEKPELPATAIKAKAKEVGASDCD